ncbi:probable E3 ubiquitin-protein ligase EDA40 isoform X2 [Cynara cardunculus var. scolymus]|uniref:probable E3 ubiquitin-protein ligase EDA40 isoform X2 n=1 Tax=Cynara cardunculus var. scolymus TaxID=59895 RepID=UPI000D62A76C|nr:probable E3 ubiquitin-protein ligase EDA40 isoform X2 [Cynara cardunculus var. scolymus]
MASKWKKVKMALGSNLCVYVPTPDEDVSPPQSERCSDVALLSPATDQWTRGGSASLPWSSALRLSRSFNRSSKKCTICLASMKRGEGQAIFTAECSHSFHFQCIASNVKHGNQICPVCRAKWKQVPLQLDPSLGRTRINSGNWSQDNPVMTVIRQFPSRQNSNRRVSAPVFPPNEPAIFNDDEPLDVQTSNSNTSDGSSFERVMIKTYTEVPGVARLTAVDDFTVLIHLKAPVSNSGPTVSQANRIPRAPVDLVTVLDISGSMAGTKLALLKRAMGFVIQNLGPADRLAVIAFSSTARRLFSLRKMSDMGKQHALQAVNSLVANGGTNIAEGLRKGGKVMEDRREKNPVSSVILLSDGQDTYTVTSGPNPDAFAQCIGGLLSVVVKGLQVIVESSNPNVRLRSLKAGSYKNHLMPDRKSGCIDVGDLYADEERDFLVSVNIPTESVSHKETSLLKVNCYYNDPLTKETVKLVSEEITIKRPQNVGKETVISIEVDRQRNRLQSAEAMMEAKTVAEEGDLARAVLILEKFRKVLSETISAKSGDRLCMALDAELKEMQERMASRHVYEASGRAYILSGLSSHSWQRATARGDSTEGSSLVQSYQTPSMTEMLSRSQAQLIIPASQPRPR